MADRLTQRLETTERALATLRGILAEPYSVIVRDASIQRFEYCFETCWKLAKAYLAQEEGLACDAPKPCFRVAAQVGLITNGDAATALRMTDDRNLTAHTYVEALAARIHRSVPGYLAVMERLVANVRTRLAPDHEG